MRIDLAHVAEEHVRAGLYDSFDHCQRLTYSKPGRKAICHGDGGMADMTALDYSMMVEDSVVDTFCTEYRLKPEDPLGSLPASNWPLMALALCDRLSDGISMVYSFFEPNAPARSLGSYMILDHIDRARRLGLPYLYLGYWIEGSRKMSYKMRFLPQEHLTPQGWLPVSPQR